MDFGRFYSLNYFIASAGRGNFLQVRLTGYREFLFVYLNRRSYMHQCTYGGEFTNHIIIWICAYPCKFNYMVYRMLSFTKTMLSLSFWKSFISNFKFQNEYSCSILPEKLDPLCPISSWTEIYCDCMITKSLFEQFHGILCYMTFQ